MDFCHITPVPHLRDFTAAHSAHTMSPASHLLLAHLIEKDGVYTKHYKDMKRDNKETRIILDNSAFEMYKQFKAMYPSEKLIELGKEVGADYVVLSDYPNQPGSVTIEAALELAPQFLRAGLKTFFVPQSKIGDLQDLLETFDWALHSPLVDYIGFSILNIPNAYGVERKNNLQRYLSRYKFVKDLEVYLQITYKKGLDQIRRENNKLFHFLGMVDGPNEIDLINTLDITIATWDSSAAVWAGLNGIEFDNSPTGLINGKFETEVDFAFYQPSKAFKQMAYNNMRIIDDKAARARV